MIFIPFESASLESVLVNEENFSFCEKTDLIISL